MSTTNAFLALLAAGFLGAACAPSATDDTTGDETAGTDELKLKATQVQMNDVSVLYPLAKTADDLAQGYMQPTSAGAQGPLLPEAIYDALIGQISQINSPPAFADLRVIAFRLDPCFAQIGPITKPAACEHQLRIIFQPIIAGQKKSQPALGTDAGFHAFYTLTADEFAAAVKEMVALRAANSTTADLGALAVHPILVKQGLRGPMAEGLRTLVLKYAGQSKLTRLTGFLSTFLQHTTWHFSALDVKSGKPTASPIVGLADAPLTEDLGLGTAGEGLLALSFPPTTTKDDVHPLMLATVQDDTDANRQAAYDAALRIENPGFHSPNTIDCVSCHTAEIARKIVGEDFFGLSSSGNTNAFVANTKIVPKADLRVTLPAKYPTDLAVNFHAFSYDGSQPLIMQRVINETAAIITALNTPPAK